MDITVFPDAETIRNELEKGSGICRPGKVSEDILPNRLKNGFLTLPSESEHLCHKAGGDLVLSIRNESYGGNDPRTRGPNTNRKLGFHTDRCSVIGFLCLQPAKTGGENHVVSSLAIERIIRTERPILHKYFALSFPLQAMSSTKETTYPTASNLSSRGKITFSPVLTFGFLLTVLTKTANALAFPACKENPWIFLIRFANAKNLQTRFTLKRGELVFLNNWTTLHRRTAFEDFSKPEKRRHFLRVWISVPNSRPLDESFRANFGATEAECFEGACYHSHDQSRACAFLNPFHIACLEEEIGLKWLYESNPDASCLCSGPLQFKS